MSDYNTHICTFCLLYVSWSVSVGLYPHQSCLEPAYWNTLMQVLNLTDRNLLYSHQSLWPHWGGKDVVLVTWLGFLTVPSCIVLVLFPCALLSTYYWSGILSRCISPILHVGWKLHANLHPTPRIPNMFQARRHFCKKKKWRNHDSHNLMTLS